MTYNCNVKIESNIPIVKEFMQIMIEKALSEMNISPIQDQKETPIAIEVTMKR